MGRTNAVAVGGWKEHQRREVLDNGLTVVVQEMGSKPVVASMIWYRVGSRHEQRGKTGTSHFLEHMMFKGTPRYAKGEIDRITLRHGGSNNAFTSHDYTAYYFNFAADRWPVALEIESSRIRESVLDSQEFFSEKQVVIEELKMGLDSPWSLLRQEVESVAFKAHPYRNPIIGWLEDLEQMQPDDLRYHYDRYYRPNNAALVLAGDLDGADTLRRVNSLFGHLKFQHVPPDHIPHEPDQIGERRVMVHRPSNLPRVLIVYHAPEIGHADSCPLQVLRRVLGQGKTSRLYRRLVEKEKLASTVTAEYEETQDPGLFYLRAEVRPGADTGRVEKALTEEVERLADEAVREAELRKAQNQMESQFVFAQESALDWASLLGFAEALCQPEYLATYLDRVRAVSARDLRRVARKYLFRDHRTVGWMLGPNLDRE